MQDRAAAFRHFAAAAKAGVGAGALEAGRALYFGTGVAKDREAAYRHFQAAVEHRIPEAYYMAGFMKFHGQGTSKDEKKGVEWLSEASDRGVIAAKGELGHALYVGTGAKADRARGRRLMEEAAAKGDQNARRYLEEMDDPLAGVSGVTPEQKADLKRLAEGKPFEMTETNMPFMAGLATAIMDQCGHPADFGERAELAAFAATTSTGLMFGNDYSNPDLGKGIGSMARHTALQAAGESVGRKLQCGQLTQQIGSGLVRAVRSNGRSADGGESRFVSSCQRQFSRTQCTCLANTARAAIPDVHRRTYQRSIIKEMIQRNPLLGFQVGMVCGIVNY